MDTPKIQFLVSVPMDTGLHPGMSVYERKSLLQRLAKSYASLFSAQDDNTDDEAAMGYESSWSGIFTSTRG
ncbi:MAG: hypothetical protein LUP91_16630 [Methylococcaceae bacterium]|jgi:hypothetical protein|nr:hypothetical protein [Methylococcaceae bacterium]